MDDLTELYNAIRDEDAEYIPPPRPRPKEKPAPKATSKRQLFIQLTADMLKVPFKTVLFKTINWPVDWIQENYEYCMKEGKPPARLWNYLYKKSKQPKQ